MPPGQLPILYSRTLSEVAVEPLECVPNKGQAHLGGLFLLSQTLAPGCLLGTEDRRVVRLVDLVGREVRRVNVGGQPWLEGCADPPKALEFHPAEEGMALDLVRAAPPEPVFRVADEAEQLA